MIGVEIDMVVTDCLAALSLYERIFETQRIEVTSYKKGNNEAIFSLYGLHFHLLDENPEYQLIAPKLGDPKSIWMNIKVTDIKVTFDRAVAAGCSVVQPLTELNDFGVINAMFLDQYGYLWMLHQVLREVSIEERCQILEQQK